MFADLKDRLVKWGWASPGLVGAALCYIWFYLADSSLPGNGSSLDGWFTWSDQKHYRDSAMALHALNLDADRHWYPLGYSLLAAPFAKLLRNQMFLPVDLLSLLVAYWAAAAFIRRLGMGGGVTALAYLPLLLNADLRRSWIAPWNTTPVAALVWLLLAFASAHMAQGRSAWRSFAMGALASAIAAIRPLDAGLAIICIASVTLRDILQHRARLVDAALVFCGGLAAAAPYAALHLAIYGWRATDYILVSQQIGFALDDIGFKAFVLLQEPTMWFGAGEGMFKRLPWLILAIAGVFPALACFTGWRRWMMATLILMVAWHFTLYLSYVDLPPPSLWSFGAIHYFKWTFPALALLGVLWCQNVWNGQRSWAIAGLGATCIVLLLRLTPEPARIDEPARMVELFGPRASWKQAYQDDFLIKDDLGPLFSLTSIRAVPSQNGVRVIALRRNFVGNLSWIDNDPGALGAITGQARYRVRLSLGWPCFLYPYPCQTTALVTPDFN